jgi:hypothetical protein
MSDLRIALVAEGPTDKIAIEAFLSAITERSFILTLLQPEALNAFGGFGQSGSGWCGVARWCRSKAAAGFGSFETDPTMTMFDLLIIHIDGDVADKQYADCGGNFPGAGLPLNLERAMVTERVEMLEKIVCEWLAIREPGARTVFCIPHLSMEAWVVASLFHGEDEFGDHLESEPNLDQWLATLPLQVRLRKNRKEYSGKATQFTGGWHDAVRICTQAVRFNRDVQNCLHLFEIPTTSSRCPSTPP